MDAATGNGVGDSDFKVGLAAIHDLHCSADGRRDLGSVAASMRLRAARK